MPGSVMAIAVMRAMCVHLPAMLAAGVLLPLGIAAVSLGLSRARARGTIVTY